MLFADAIMHDNTYCDVSDLEKEFDYRLSTDVIPSRDDIRFFLYPFFCPRPKFSPLIEALLFSYNNSFLFKNILARNV